MSGKSETTNEVVLKTESNASIDERSSCALPLSLDQVKNEPRSPLLVQAPPPPSGLDWASAYAAKKLALASASSISSHNQSRSVVKVEVCEKADVKVEFKDIGENTAGVGASMESRTLKKVPGVILKDVAPDKPPVSSLSNRQSKKIEQQEGRKTSVEKLIKRVTVDKDKGSNNWAAEYEARKEVALERMESGVTAANVGSLSAFHTGVYGTMESDAIKTEPISVTANTATVKPACSSESNKPAFLHALRESDAKESSTSIPASPMTLVQTRKSFATLLPASNLASLSCNSHTSNHATKQGPEVSPSESSLDPTPKKAPTMAQLFREVKADAKRSQSDWQAEYEARKRARMEVQRKEQDKIKLAKISEQPKSTPPPSHHHSFQKPPLNDKSKAHIQDPRSSMPSPNRTISPQANFQTQGRPSVVNYHQPYSTSNSVPPNRGMAQNIQVPRAGNFSPGRGYQDQPVPQVPLISTRGYPQNHAHNRGYMRPNGINVSPRPRGHWPPSGQVNFPRGSNYNRHQFRGQRRPQFGRGFHRGYNRPPF